MSNEQLAKEMLESLRSMTDEEHEVVMEKLVRDGIMDREGNVLKRFPEPPEWLTQANGRTKSAESTKKPKRPRKRS